MPNMNAIKTPLRDGDTERDDEAYRDSYFLNANSISKPQIVDRHLQPILDPDEIYSGMYARVSLSFYAFNVNGNRGVACGLGNDSAHNCKTILVRLSIKLTRTSSINLTVN